MRKLLVLALVTGSAYAAAQKSLPQFEVSYYRSDSITLNGGGSGTLQGLNLGISSSLVSVPLFGDARIRRSVRRRLSRAKPGRKALQGFAKTRRANAPEVVELGQIPDFDDRFQEVGKVAVRVVRLRSMARRCPRRCVRLD